MKGKSARLFCSYWVELRTTNLMTGRVVTPMTATPISTRGTGHLACPRHTPLTRTLPTPANRRRQAPRPQVIIVSESSAEAT